MRTVLLNSHTPQVIPGILLKIPSDCSEISTRVPADVRTILNECFNIVCPAAPTGTDDDNTPDHDIDQLYGEVRRFHDLAAKER